MSSTVVFWFSWFWKALLSMPKFLGNNKVGATFAFMCVLFYEGKNLYQIKSFKAAKSRSRKRRVFGAFFMRHWKKTLQFWLYIALAFWVGHTLDLVYQNANSLTVDNGILLKKNSDDRLICTKEQNDLGLLVASNKSRADTLSNQNIDQQSTINLCQTEAIKLLEPKQLAVHVYDLRRLLVSSQEQVDIVKSPILLLVNKPVTPVTVVANCTAPIEDLQAFALAPNMDSTLQLNTSRNGPNSMVANIPSPAVTPDAPFVLMLVHKKSDALNCHFNVQ